MVRWHILVGNGGRVEHSSSKPGLKRKDRDRAGAPLYSSGSPTSSSIYLSTLQCMGLA